jgi:hypothetical protein
MELAVLNENFKRMRPVENWSSLTWAERYSSAGEFELVSHNIEEMLTLLPKRTDGEPDVLVAIEDSDVPMIVEDHKIETPKNSPPKITISGRAFESVLDRRQAIRAVTSGVKRAEWIIDAAPTSAVAAYEVIKAIVVDGQATPLDIIPEIHLLNAVVDAGVGQKYPVEPKELYAWVLETLTLGKFGLRSALSPVLVNQILVEIYKGVDRRTTVVFDVALEQFDDAAYLFSKKGSKNTIITATTNGMEFSNRGSAASGLARRVGYQDISSEVTVPAGADLTNLTVNKGKVALADLLPTALFSGGVAADLGAGYNDIFRLGDIVTLQGEFGLSEDARIAEFIRTDDQTGQKAYPTFEAVNI